MGLVAVRASRQTFIDDLLPALAEDLLEPGTELKITIAAQLTQRLPAIALEVFDAVEGGCCFHEGSNREECSDAKVCGL